MLGRAFCLFVVGGREDDDRITEYRMKLQKKAWRSKCFLSSPARTRHAILIVWIGAAIAWLTSHLQVLDSATNGLLDAIVANSANPFVRAEAEISLIVRTGFVGGTLAPLRAFFIDLDAAIIQVRQIGLNFIAQVRWRFLEYGTFSRKLGLLCHHGVPESEVKAELDDLFYKCLPCCRDRASQNVVDMFKTPERLMADEPFRHAVTTFAHVYKFTDMWTENLLSLIRRASASQEDADVERLIASGFLTQLLVEHRTDEYGCMDG